MQIQDTPSAPNLHQRIRAVMMDVRRLQKDKQVGSGNYAYKAMSEEKVTSIVRESMIAHGLTLLPIRQAHTMCDYTRPGRNGEATIVSLSTVDVVYKLTNVDAPHEFEEVVSSGTGVDPQDKGVGKAMTYAYKYALLRAFGIPTGQDPDDVHNEELAVQQAANATPATEPSVPMQPASLAELHELAAQLPDARRAAVSTWLTKGGSEAGLQKLLTKVRAELAAPADV